LVIEGHRHPVQDVRRSHRKGASAARADQDLANPIFPCREALFADLSPSTTPVHPGQTVDRGLGSGSPGVIGTRGSKPPRFLTLPWLRPRHFKPNRTRVPCLPTG